MKVYITCEIAQNGIDLLKKEGFSVEVNDSGHKLTKRELLEVFSQFDAVVTLVSDTIDEEVINNAAGKIKVIANFGVGFDNIDVLAAKRKGIIVTNTPGVAAEAVAEHTFSLILACIKHLIPADKFVRSGRYHGWNPDLFLSKQIWGKTIGIVGLGRIGAIVGNIAFSGFKMKILYTDRTRAEDFELLTEAQFAPLKTILREADVLSLHVPLTPGTRHMIGKEEFKMMKETAIMVNTARGAVVDEHALLWALKEKVIAAAGIDVFENESNVSAELRSLSNIVLSPHIASATVETREEMARIAAQNIIDVFEGKTPFGLVKVE